MIFKKHKEFCNRQVSSLSRKGAWLMLLTGSLFVSSSALNAQVISNNGAAITVTSNAAITTKDILTSGSVANDGTMRFSGNWENTGTVASGSGLWWFNGSTNQHIINPNNNERFFTLIVQNSGATVLLDNSLVLDNKLLLQSGTLELGNNSFAVGDSANITGVLSDNNAAGTDLFKGLVTVKPGGNWNISGNNDVEFRGGITHNGTAFSSGTGQYTFTTNNQDLNAASQIVFNAKINVNGVVLNNKTNIWTTASSILTSSNSGKWQNGINSRLRFDYTGPVEIMNGEIYASANGNTVWYAGNGDQKIGSKTSYYNLLMGTAGIKKTSAPVNVLHKLSLADSVTLDITAGKMQVFDSLLLSNGLIDATGATNKITLGQTTSRTGALSFTNGTIFGLFERWLNAPGNIQFPVGDKATSTGHLATFKLNSLSSGGSLMVRFNSGDPGNNGLSLVDKNDSSEIWDEIKSGFWSAQALNSFSTANYDLHLIAIGMDTVPINPGTRIIKRVSGQPWTLDGTHADAVDPQVNRLALKSGVETTSANEYGLGRSRPLIVRQPRDTAVCDGFDARFTVYATGTNPLKYQWYKDGATDIKLTNDGHFSGTTTASLLIHPAFLTDAGTYYCVITDRNNNQTISFHATLIVNPIPVISLASHADTICNKTTIIISPGSSVPGSSYEWTISQVEGGVAGAFPGSGSVISQILNHNNTYESSVNYGIRPVGPAPTRCRGSYDTVRVHVNPTPRLNVSFNDPDTLLCSNTAWQREFPMTFTVKTPNVTTGKVWYRLSVGVLHADSLAGYTDSINAQVESIVDGHVFTDSIYNLGHEVESIVYTFTPYIREAKTGLDCGYGVPRSVTVRILPPLRVTALSDSLGSFFGGWDIRCHGYKTGKIDLKRNGGYPVYNPSSAYSYEWKDSSLFYHASTQNLTNLRAGRYQVKVNDNNGCIGYDTIRLSQPDTLSGNIEVIQSIVCAGVKGKIRVRTNGGGTMLSAPSTESYKIDWKFGLRKPLRNVVNAHNDTLGNLTANRYWVFLRDANGCPVDDFKDLNGPDSVKIDLDKIQYDASLNSYISCIGNNDGAFKPRLSGGSAPYTLTVTGPDTYEFRDSSIMYDSDIPWLDSLVPGYYEVFAMDSNGCQKFTYVTIAEPPAVNITLIPSVPYPGNDSIQISCFGKQDGSITPSLTGGYHHYSYQWSAAVNLTDPASASQESLKAGTYYLAVADTALPLDTTLATPKVCYAYDSITLKQPPDLVLADTTFSTFVGDSNLSCYGATDGSITIGLEGGIGTRNYTWTRLSTGPAGNLQPATENQEGITAGDYKLQVDYGLACTASWVLHLSQPDSMDLHAVLRNNHGFEVSCYGGDDGFIHTAITGGTGPYRYRWNTNDGVGIDSLAASQDSITIGSYQVAVTDTNGCVQHWTFMLNQPTPLISVIDSVYPIACNGQKVGGIDILVNGGVADYNYLWDGGTDPYTRNVRGLDSGMHYVRITDLNNCSILDSALITSPDPIVVYDTLFSRYAGGYNVSCFEGENGSIRVRTRGGFGNRGYRWNTGNTSDTVFNLPAGVYTLLTTDDYHCTDTATFLLTQPERLMATASVTNVLCHDSITGAINIAPQGGTTPYRFNWSNGAVSQNISSLPARDYELILSDANNCAFDTIIQVSQPTRIQMEVEKVLPYCQETEDGKIALHLSGGKPGYENSTVSMIRPDREIPFTAPGNDHVIAVENADVGYFSFHIVDSNACTIDTTVFLNGYRSICLNIPNVFTPNGDGENDFWRISYGRHKSSDDLGQAYPDLVVEVFNRWGQNVYKSDKGYPELWDGRKKDKSLLPIDSYYYVIRVNDEMEPITGVVTIVY